MMCLVERDGSITLNILQRPWLQNEMFFAVNYGNHLLVGQVCKDAASILFHDKSLRLSGQGYLRQQFSFWNCDDGNSSLIRSYATYIEFLGARVIVHLIRIGLKIHAGNQVQCLAVIDGYALSPRHIELIELGRVEGRSRPFAIQALQEFA